MLSRSVSADTRIRTLPFSDTESETYWQAAYSLIATVSLPTSSVGIPTEE